MPKSKKEIENEISALYQDYLYYSEQSMEVWQKAYDMGKVISREHANEAAERAQKDSYAEKKAIEINNNITKLKKELDNL